MATSQRPKRSLKRGLPMRDQYNWEPIGLDKRDSVFSAQELIADLIRKNPSDIETILELPQGVDRSVWILDHLKRFLIQLGYLLVHLENECDNEKCPHMMATENFAYRCSVHGPRMLKNCNAVSYALHTLDDFVRKFNHPNYQSRTKVDKKFEREYTQCCRRTYRIFAHAFWHHKDSFEKYEREHFLCSRFIMFIRLYKLIPEKIFLKDKQIPTASLYFDRAAREKAYKYFIFQKEQRLKQDREKLEKERKEKAKNASDNNNNKNDDTKNDADDGDDGDEERVIKEDSDDSSSEEENGPDINIQTAQAAQAAQAASASKSGAANGKAKKGNEDDLDEEAALAEIYSDDPI